MTETSLRKVLRLFALLFAMSIVVAACGSDDDPADTATDDTTAPDTSDEGDGDDAEEDSGLPDLEGRTVTVGVENAYLPFNYVAVGGDAGEGWDYDAWNEICRLLNCEADFVAAGWPDVIDQVAQGDIDTAADGISITDDRMEIVDFSTPYMTVQQKFIVGLDDDRYATAADIIDGDAIVATQVGTTNFELAEELLGGTDRIQAFDQFGLAIQALISGDVDAVIIDDAAGLGYIGENADKVKTIDDGLQSDPLGFIYEQGSDLVAPVDLAIEEMKSSGFLDEIGAKFFGTEFTVSYDDIADVVLPGAEEGDDTEEESALADLEGRTVTVGVENAYLPFNYVAVGGDAGEGWDYDAWNEICRLLNCEADFVAAGWPDVIDQVAQGDIDTAADGISITDDRMEIVDFSTPYMTVQQKFIVGLDDDRYATAADIIDGDAIVATQVGTTNFELAEELLGGTDRIQAFDQFGLAIQALISGDVDAVIIDDAAGLGYIGENADKVKTIDDGLQSDPLGFIYEQGSDLVAPVNAAIEEMKSSGFLDEIGTKFFGTEFTVTYDDIADVELG